MRCVWFLPCSHTAQVIGPIRTPALEEDWQATVASKREIYGRRFRIAVGGRTIGAPSEGTQRRKDDDAEAAFHLSAPPEFYEDIVARFFVRHAVGLTVGPGTFAAVCVARRIGYFGVCFSEKHRESVMKRLELATLGAIVTVGSSVYDPRATAVLKPAKPGKKDEEKPAKPGKKTEGKEDIDKPKKGGKPKPNKKDKGKGDDNPPTKEGKKQTNTGNKKSGEKTADGGENDLSSLASGDSGDDDESN